MRPTLLVGGREGDVGAQQRLGAHRRSDGGGRQERLCLEQRQDPDRRHLLGTIEQSQAFLGQQPHWFEAAPAECLCAVEHFPVQLGPAAADERQAQVRQWRQVTRSANRALLGHLGVDAQAQEIEQPLDDLGPAAALAAGERVGAQQQHRPHRRAVMGGAHARRVADEQVLLQPLGVGGRDALAGEMAEAGGDPVDRLAGAHEFLDRRAAGRHPLTGAGMESCRRTIARHAGDVLEGQLAAGQRKMRQSTTRRIPMTASNPRSRLMIRSIPWRCMTAT